jgi:hypothetical protein
MNYVCDLHERMAKANWARKRYHECDRTRLHRVNLVRQRRGLAPYASPDEIPTRSHAARSQSRGERGRFA